MKNSRGGGGGVQDFLIWGSNLQRGAWFVSFTCMLIYQFFLLFLKILHENSNNFVSKGVSSVTPPLKKDHVSKKTVQSMM